jgi:hypothetical protein
MQPSNTSKKSKLKIIIPIVGVVVVAAIVAIILLLVVSKKDDAANTDSTNQNSTTSNEQSKEQSSKFDFSGDKKDHNILIDMEFDVPKSGYSSMGCDTTGFGSSNYASCSGGVNYSKDGNQAILSIMVSAYKGETGSSMGTANISGSTDEEVLRNVFKTNVLDGWYGGASSDEVETKTKEYDGVKGLLYSFKKENGEKGIVFVYKDVLYFWPFKSNIGSSLFAESQKDIDLAAAIEQYAVNSITFQK